MKLLESLLAMVREALPELPFYGFYEYSVFAQAGDRISGRPTDASLGLPDIEGVPMWRSAGGVKGTLAPGGKVLVGFVNGSPTRPYVAFVHPDATVLTATLAPSVALDLGDGLDPRRVARTSPIPGIGDKAPPPTYEIVHIPPPPI